MTGALHFNPAMLRSSTISRPAVSLSPPSYHIPVTVPSRHCVTSPSRHVTVTSPSRHTSGDWRQCRHFVGPGYATSVTGCRCSRCIVLSHQSRPVDGDKAAVMFRPPPRCPPPPLPRRLLLFLARRGVTPLPRTASHRAAERPRRRRLSNRHQSRASRLSSAGRPSGVRLSSDAVLFESAPPRAVAPSRSFVTVLWRYAGNEP